MAEIVVDLPVSTPRKRSHEGDLVAVGSTTLSDDLTSDPHKTPSRQLSPALSDYSSELTELTSTGVASPNTIKVFVGDASNHDKSSSVSTKKRKLTFAEKEVEKAVKQREKEEKTRQKLEEKTRKDEEKRKKEEEKETSKRAKELEKAEKKKIRDADKQEKEIEKAKKEADKRERETNKLKKEKSQLRIGAFFGRPAPQSTPPATPDDVSSRNSSRRSSIAAIDIPGDEANPDVCKPVNPDFDKYIIPYFIHDNTEVAPTNRFKTARETEFFQGKSSKYELEIEKRDVEPLRARFGPPRKRMRMSEPVKDIVERIQATQVDIADIDDEQNPLSYVPYKILSFREDIRPPYTGTYTRTIVSGAALKMSRNPSHRGRTDTNYDYDSEAEWEEPAADDEEILDDEVSESEDGDEEMQDFLDDENDQVRKRLFVGEMEPVSSGLCFQGSHFDSNGHNMEDYRMDVLHDSVTWPIDPFSTVHWADVRKPVSTKPKAESESVAKADVGAKSMPPPRAPLTTLSSSNIIVNYLSSDKTPAISQEEIPQPLAKQRGRPANPNKEAKMIPSEFMEAFKQAIGGSDLTKAGLIEILKKQFPKCSKDAIKDTLGIVAVRVGKKEAEKTWVVI